MPLSRFAASDSFECAVLDALQQGVMIFERGNITFLNMPLRKLLVTRCPYSSSSSSSPSGSKEEELPSSSPSRSASALDILSDSVAEGNADSPDTLSPVSLLQLCLSSEDYHRLIHLFCMCLATGETSKHRFCFRYLAECKERNSSFSSPDLLLPKKDETIELTLDFHPFLKEGRAFCFVNQDKAVAPKSEKNASKWYELNERITPHMWCFSELTDDFSDRILLFPSPACASLVFRKSQEELLNVSMSKHTWDSTHEDFLRHVMIGVIKGETSEDPSFDFSSLRGAVWDLSPSAMKLEIDGVKRVYPVRCWYSRHTLTLEGYSAILFTRMTYLGINENGRHLFHLSSEDATTSHHLRSQVKSKEAELIQTQEESEVFRQIFLNSPSPMGVIHFNEDWSMKYHSLLNPAARAIIPPNFSLIFEEFRATEEGKLHLLKYQQCKETNEPFTHENRASWNGKYFIFTVSHIRDNTFAFMAQDISSLKSLESEVRCHNEHLEELVAQRTLEVEKALAAKSRFLAIMSHEIRTPLAGIISSLELLFSSTLSPPQQELLHTAKICSEQLLTVINDILDFSKMEQNKFQLRFEEISLHRVIQDATRVVHQSAMMKKIALVYDIENVPSKIWGDAGRLRQVLVNLLSNAVKFTPAHSKVVCPLGEESPRPAIVLKARVEEFREGEIQIKFSVKDCGIGIAEKNHKDIFQPFSQVDSSQTRKHSGSGLGLSICKRLVELMNGSIWFESKEGEGATFHFRIRTKRIAFQPCLPVIAELPKTKKVWVVTDVKEEADSLSKALLSLNIISVRYDSPGRALSHIQASVERGETPEEVFAVVDADACNSSLLLDFFSNSLPHLPIVCLMSKTYIAGYSASVSLTKPLCPRNFLGSVREILHNYYEAGALVALPGTAKACPDVSAFTPAPSPLPPPSSPSLELSILLVEDNELSSKLMLKMLKSLGCESVDLAENGLQAVEAVKKSSYDLILMDIMMPVMGGVEATREIRALLRSDPPPPYIVALTANAFAEDRDQYLAEGMHEVITKPVELRTMKNLLSSIREKRSPNSLLKGER